MAKKYSQHFRRQTQSLSGEDPVYLLEITHSALAIPVRATNDSDDVISQGNKFIPIPFRIRFPDDIAQQMPRIPISIDNVGRELTQWLDASGGGRGAKFRIMQVMRDNPDFIEQEYTLTLISAKQNVMEISGELGYENYLDMPCLAALYTPETANGLF